MSSDIIHPNFPLSRRTLLRAFSTGALLLLQACTMPTRTEENIISTSEFSPDIEIRLTARQASLNSPRSYELTMSNMQWLINGKQFEMETIDTSEKVAFNSLEVWEFINQPAAATMSNMNSGNSMARMDHGKMGGMNMGSSDSNNTTNNQGVMNDFMAHPMHIHGVQFEVLERQIDPAYINGWQTLKDGYVDEGWKDTVLVMPGERVKLLLRFNEYTGRYLVHCHNLEHESMGMMRNFLIEG